jgi:hypothetical protein
MLANQCSKTNTREGTQAFRTRTGLYRHSNQSLLASENSARKGFGETRDWAGFFRDAGLFRATETTLSRVSGGKATES